MGFNFIGFLAFCFIGMTLLNRILEGTLLAAADVAIINNLTITRDYSIFGLFNVPILNTDFFFTGIPRLVKWDYSYFGGNAQIIQFFLYSLTFALAFLLFTYMIGLAFNYLSRR